MNTNVEQLTEAYHALHTAAEMLGKPKLKVEKNRKGPQHKETWTVSIELDGVVYCGVGSNEKTAKQKAAINALKDAKNEQVRERALSLHNPPA